MVVGTPFYSLAVVVEDLSSVQLSFVDVVMRDV